MHSNCVRERLSARLAAVFGVLLGVIEVWYNWGEASWWPFILVDYIAVALLLYGAWRSPRVLTGGWGFACAMFYMAFFVNWQEGTPLPLLTGMGILFAWTIVGFLVSLGSLPRGASS